MTDQIAEALAYLAGKGVTAGQDVAVVLGTGLGRFAEAVSDRVEIAYADIPGFPRGHVSGHAGKLVAGKLEGRRVLVFQGRAHYYETGDPRAMRTPLGVAAKLGVKVLLVTNAAGSLKLDLRPGQIVILRDHINFSGLNPLIGETGDRRFVSMTDAYDDGVRKRLKRAAAGAGTQVHEGIYMWFSGPSFETPAEVRMAKTLGADLVGMSTVPEVILARFFGLKVGALSIVTNLASGIEGAKPTHKETRDIAFAATIPLDKLLRRYIAEVENG